MEHAVVAGYPIVLPAHRAAFHRDFPNWHKAWLDSIHETLKPDDVVVDVGVEQGDLSALVASWIPEGRISLIEPVAGFWPTIRETFKANGLGPPEAAFVGFAANEYAYRDVSKERWPVESTNATNDDPGFQHLNERADLPRITVDMFCSLIRPLPTALLVDVEGAELHVLRGAENLLRGYSGLTPKPTVWCAIHPDFMRDRYGHDPNELLAFMWRLGYRWEFLAFHSEMHFMFSPR